MGAADGSEFRKGPPAFKRDKEGGKEKNFLQPELSRRICQSGENLR
jgi:hypothetical protein